MKQRWFSWIACSVFGVCALACGAPAANDDAPGVEQTRVPLTASTAAGVVPTGLPGKVVVGLFEDTGGRWLTTSGVPWSARYRYFTKGWVNNWGWSSYDGSWGLAYLKECDSQGYIPAVQYYQLVGEAGGGESATLSKVQNATTMKSYFGDFKILMQRVKDFGKPVIVLLEADGPAFLEQQTAGNPNAAAAVASTGLPELAGLPNTVAGWGLAFLQLRKAVGASNAILAIHVSAWATGKDVAYASVSDPLQPEVDKAYAFLAALGLGPNLTGQSYDLLVGDPLDRDSDYYRLTQSQDRWWDATDSASISSKSFNRYAEWLRLWNVKASRRWVLWQIPLGNSNHKNVYNNGNPAEGYKDNRPEYFFASGTAHIAKFADSGVIALLFGAGAGGQSSYTNDTFTDGQLFMKSRAGAFLKAGGLTIATGTATGTGSAGSGGAVSAGAGAGAVASGDSSQYNFEGASQGWTTSGGILTSAQSSADRAFAGTRSLKVTISGAASQQSVRVAAPAVAPGKSASFHIWIPTGSSIASIQPYVLQGAAGGWTWTGAWRSSSQLSSGQWNTLTVQVPANAATPLAELGVQVATSATYSGAIYVDAVSW